MRICRFVDELNHIQFGCEFVEGRATLLSGNINEGFKNTGKVVGVKRLLSPIAPNNVICIGLNYHEHAKETGAELPVYPIMFMKNTASVIASGDNIEIPQSCLEPLQVDYEGELVAVIGKAARNVKAEDALNYVLGYTIANDVSARRWQKHAGGNQWVKAKSFDTFCPLGPEIVTTDEIADPQTLAIQTHINGELMQNGKTADMIFSVAQIIQYLSQDTTLLPGTVILTGTPSGVGMARTPRVFLKPGDKVTITIPKIGILSNPVTISQ